MYIHDLCMTLTFDLYVGGGGFLSEFYSQFLSCWLWIDQTFYSSINFSHFFLVCDNTIKIDPCFSLIC